MPHLSVGHDSRDLNTSNTFFQDTLYILKQTIQTKSRNFITTQSGPNVPTYRGNARIPEY